MNNEEIKKKICKIIADNYLPKEMPDRLEDYKLYRFKRAAEALIAAGIGDVKEAGRKAFCYSAEITHLDNKLKETEHRAEVAERALDKAVELAYEYRTEADTLSCSSCPMGDELFPKCKDRGLYKECSKRWKEQLIEQAERELAEEEKE